MVKIFDNAVSRRGSTAGRGRCPTAPLCPTGTTTEPPALTLTSSPSHQVTQTPYDPLDPAQATGAPTECQPTGARRRRLEGERGRVADVAGLLFRRALRFGNHVEPGGTKISLGLLVQSNSSTGCRSWKVGYRTGLGAVLSRVRRHHWSLVSNLRGRTHDLKILLNYSVQIL